MSQKKEKRATVEFQAPIYEFREAESVSCRCVGHKPSELSRGKGWRLFARVDAPQVVSVRLVSSYADEERVRVREITYSGDFWVEWTCRDEQKDGEGTS